MTIPKREAVDGPGFDAEFCLLAELAGFGITGRDTGGDTNRPRSSGNHGLSGHRGAINTILHWDNHILFFTAGIRWNGGNV